MRFATPLLLFGAWLAGPPLAAQLAPVPGDQRQADRDAIRDHIDKIFQGFIHQDPAPLRAGHAAEWRGFLEGSREIRKGLDSYMQAVGGELKSPEHIRAYKMLSFDVMFYGDVAVVPYIAEVEAGAEGHTVSEKLRVLDVYAKLNGDWIQIATDTTLHPEAQAQEMSRLETPGEALKKKLLEAREAVWRAYFSADLARLGQDLPPEVIAVDEGREEWSRRDEILAGAKRFAGQGGKLVRLEFPRTEIQLFGYTAILYSTYLYEVELQGARHTTSGRATETFVFRDGKWVNVGWHLDQGVPQAH